jgi:SPP1 family predicted phage head-tail adaptor
MRIGRLDERITIESYTEANNAMGEPGKTWTTLATVWANVRPLRGSERFVAQQVHAERTLVFTIRHRSDIDETMRIVHDSDNYDIQALIEIGRHQFWEIHALAPVPA